MSDTCTVFVEENVRYQLDSIQSKGIGVLVGRLTSKESFVLHFVPTPALEESPEDYRGDGLPSEEWWIEDHAHQVWDHLPGGISVVGLCLISPSLGESAAAALYKLTRQLQKPRELLPSSVLPHFLIGLHFSTLTQSLTCKRLDPDHVKDVEVIVCSLPNLWCCLESTVPIQLETLVPMSSVDSSPAQLITDFDMWQSDIYVLRGQYCHGEEPLANYVQGGFVTCTLYPKCKALKCGQSQLVDNGRVMTVCGSIAALAYVPQKCTVAEAFKAVSGDLVQAMTVSWRKMCEDVRDYSHQKKQLKGTWCLPQRIQLCVKEWRFALCAYRFPDETDEDVYERVCEVFGIDVTNICCKPHLNGDSSPTKASTDSTGRIGLSVWLVIAAGIIALIAIILFV